MYSIRFPTYFIHFTALVTYILACLYLHDQCPCAVIYAVLGLLWLCTYPCFTLFSYIMFTHLSLSRCFFYCKLLFCVWFFVRVLWWLLLVWLHVCSGSFFFFLMHYTFCGVWAEAAILVFMWLMVI